MSVYKNSGRDYFLQIARNEVPTHQHIHKFGLNVSVPTAGAIIWTGGSNYTFLTVASVLTLVSSSANDSSAGTGLNTVTVYGLDTDYLLVTEDFTLNGTSNVVGTTEFLRVFRGKGLTAGSGTKAAGTISISAGATLQAQIPAGNSNTQMAIFTVPANCTAYMHRIYGSVLKSGGGGSAIAADLHLHIIKDGVEHMTIQLGMQNTGTTLLDYVLAVPDAITEKTDIFIEAHPTATAEIAAGFELVLVDGDTVSNPYGG